MCQNYSICSSTWTVMRFEVIGEGVMSFVAIVWSIFPKSLIGDWLPKDRWPLSHTVCTYALAMWFGFPVQYHEYHFVCVCVCVCVYVCVCVWLQVFCSAFDQEWGQRAWIAILVIPLVIFSWIRSLEELTVFSMIANVCILFSLVVIIYEEIYRFT